MCRSEMLAKLSKSILWVYWESLICLSGRGLGVIADNGKWEMGNATNKRQEEYKVRSRNEHILFIVPCILEGLALGTILQIEIINKYPIVAFKLFPPIIFLYTLLFVQPSINSTSLPLLLV